MTPETLKVLKSLEEGNPPHPDAGLFGADIASKEASLVLIPVPWDLTTSYGKGTKAAPEAILRASHQLDLLDLKFGKPFLAGISMLEEPAWIKELNNSLDPLAAEVITAIEHGAEPNPDALHKINTASERLNAYVYETAAKLLREGKHVGVVGGDHSVPLGLIKALGEKYPSEKGGFGILHVDAHHDLRCAYEGFTQSHASIMYNAIVEEPAVSKLVAVAIRDFSSFEYEFALKHRAQIKTYYANEIFARKAVGESFYLVVTEILGHLPEHVYVSFDIDGLEPTNCPSTGTPVPGGLSYHEALYLLEALALAGKKVIGFDLCEVCPAPDGNEWDANVGARILYKLCGSLLYSNRGKAVAL